MPNRQPGSPGDLALLPLGFRRFGFFRFGHGAIGRLRDRFLLRLDAAIVAYLAGLRVRNLASAPDD